ncbi:SRPBCC domain-containing protein [Fulvivirga ulvae]|uniref:SRPBCC family protein n=1 Tax=Fulvivirga ulvae TaxID=2904245 RepID=UPI001F3D67BD|nr:SRPBCC domain-containing protein [Fulvivirga ulvae]UII29567.1 SRPBCC domain-containing protein [Fulvivirga ulvae]
METMIKQTMQMVHILIISLILSYGSYAQKNTENQLTENTSKQTDMNNQDFTATIFVDATPEKAYNSIKDFRAWWSEDIEGPTDRLNEEFFYHYKDIHLCKIKLIGMEENRKLMYEVLDNEFNFIEDKTEWVGTRLIFEITEEGSQTKVKFTHKGLVPSYECYEVCNDAWTGYITNSLYKLITEGKGEPNPKNKDGFNADLAEKWNLN